jgi:hypothetical protein
MAKSIYIWMYIVYECRCVALNAEATHGVLCNRRGGAVLVGTKPSIYRDWIGPQTRVGESWTHNMSGERMCRKQREGEGNTDEDTGFHLSTQEP